MASVNRVILIGNLGKDPEVRYAPSGAAVCNISIATSSRRKDKATGESIEETQWHRVTFYDRLAEVAGEYLKKGRPVYVEGRLKYGKYTDKDGVERNTVEIIASEMQLLGGREGGDGHESGSTSGYTNRAPAAREAPQRAPTQGASTGPNNYANAKAGRPQQATMAPAADDQFSDDIPF